MAQNTQNRTHGRTQGTVSVKTADDDLEHREPSPVFHWEELIEIIMIHFGRSLILAFGKKTSCKRFSKLFCVLLCLSLLFCSCEGWYYSITFSLQELETGLLSIEVVDCYWDVIEDKEVFEYTVLLTMDQEEQQEVLETLSQVTFSGKVGPPEGNLYYGFKLNYADRFMVFCPYDIRHYDNNCNSIEARGKDCHDLEKMQDPLYYMLFEKYFPNKWDSSWYQ